MVLVVDLIWVVDWIMLVDLGWCGLILVYVEIKGVFVGGCDDGEATAGCDGAGDGGPALQVSEYIEINK